MGKGPDLFDRKNLLDLSPYALYIKSMSNENRHKEVIEEYTRLTGLVYESLERLQVLMESTSFDQAREWDEDNNDGDACMYGHYEAFVDNLRG